MERTPPGSPNAWSTRGPSSRWREGSTSTLSRVSGAPPLPPITSCSAFFGKSPFVLTGPPVWNTLGLGATALFAITLVYNTKRTGEVVLDGRRYWLRRVAFPKTPTAEYFV